MPKIYAEQNPEVPDSYGAVMEIKLGNGNKLLIHDLDLEEHGQAWYEEVKTI